MIYLGEPSFRVQVLGRLIEKADENQTKRGRHRDYPQLDLPPVVDKIIEHSDDNFSQAPYDQNEQAVDLAHSRAADLVEDYRNEDIVADFEKAHYKSEEKKHLNVKTEENPNEANCGPYPADYEGDPAPLPILSSI